MDFMTKIELFAAFWLIASFWLGILIGRFIHAGSQGRIGTRSDRRSQLSAAAAGRRHA